MYDVYSVRPAHTVVRLVCKTDAIAGSRSLELRLLFDLIFPDFSRQDNGQNYSVRIRVSSWIISYNYSIVKTVWLNEKIVVNHTKPTCERGIFIFLKQHVVDIVCLAVALAEANWMTIKSKCFPSQKEEYSRQFYLKLWEEDVVKWGSLSDFFIFVRISIQCRTNRHFFSRLIM